MQKSQSLSFTKRVKAHSSTYRIGGNVGPETLVPEIDLFDLCEREEQGQVASIRQPANQFLLSQITKPCSSLLGSVLGSQG